jgi:hypothetical protein
MVTVRPVDAGAYQFSTCGHDIAETDKKDDGPQYKSAAFNSAVK